MSSPVIWNGTSAKLLNSGKIIDKDGVPFIQQKEINYIANSSAHSNIAGWANVGDLDVARTTTASELPREHTTPTGIKITADANTQSVADYVYYDFTLDDVDLNKKLKIQWAQKQTGSYVAGNLAVVITTQADRTTAIATPDVTAIPAYDGVFTASFDTASTATLSLVIRATTDMATDAGIVISDVIVGPGQIIPVPAVGNWESWTPTGNITTNATYTGKKMRVGPNGYYEVNISFSGTNTQNVNATINMPSGETIDDSALVQATSRDRSLGEGTFYDLSATAGFPLRVGFSANAVTLYTLNDNASGANYILTTTVNPNSNIPVAVASGDSITARFSVPIAEWAGAPNYAGSNDYEVAFNSSATTSADTTSFGYGWSGAAIQAFAPSATSAIQKRVRFLTPFQDGEIPRVILKGLDGKWYDAIAMAPNVALYDGTTHRLVGVRPFPVSGSNTDVDVYFYSGSRKTDSAAGVQAWSTFAGTFTHWAVIKGKIGVAFGFGAATATSMGLVSTTTQTLAGDKTLNGSLTASSFATQTAFINTTTDTNIFTLSTDNYASYIITVVRAGGSGTGGMYLVARDTSGYSIFTAAGGTNLTASMSSNIFRMTATNTGNYAYSAIRTR